ncbi:hypothetical protein EOM86_14850 [Candidatus Nomurabacteria bacterium]|nr:hypothetical protein [Candidatus Nomurabacteria bacterium]
MSSRLCHWGMQRLGYDKFREITIQGLFGDGVFMEYVRQTGSHNIVMTEEVMEQLSSERMADNITLQQVFNYMGETPVILIVDGYTSVIIDYTVKHRINILRCVRPDDFERGVPHKFGIKKGEGFTYVIEDDEFNNPLLTHFSKACLWTPDTSDSTKEGDEFFSKMLRVFINSTLMLKCTNLEADTESILIRKDKGTNNKKKMKKNRRAVRMEDHMFSFIDMNTVRFRDTGRKKEEKEQDIEEHEGRKSPRPHMRVGHFRTQWYKNEAGNKFSQIIFIRATAVRGGGSDDRYIFNVVR